VASKRQYSFTLTSGAERAMKRRLVGVRPNKSKIISSMVERYAWLVRGQAPLEGDDLTHLLGLTRGWDLDVTIAHSLANLVSSSDVPENLNVRKSDLVNRLENMSNVQLVAILDQLEMERGRPRVN
jgi:hypothetical protein